jgi:uncharacterized protein with PIN domain
MSEDGTGEGKCFYCGAVIEYSGETKIITTTGTNEFECWECHNCNRRYLVEPMGEDEDE